jgi:hypothetical protein
MLSCRVAVFAGDAAVRRFGRIETSDGGCAAGMNAASRSGWMAFGRGGDE